MSRAQGMLEAIVISTVTVQVDEKKKENIMCALCEDCPAATGGCKHAQHF